MTYTLIPLKVLCLLTIFCLYGSLSYASVNSKPFVVPELKQWTGKDGNFTPGTNAKIVCTSANPELLRIAQMFADDYQQMFGKTLSVTQGKATPGDFILSLSAEKSWEKRVMKSRLPIGSRLLLPPRQGFTGAHVPSCK